MPHVFVVIVPEYVTVTAEKMVTDATGKLLNVHKFDQTVFKMSASWALGYDVINRLSLEPSFEAIIDAGE